MADRNQTFRRCSDDGAPVLSNPGGFMKQTKTRSALVAGALLVGSWMFGADQKGSSAEVELQAAIHTEMVDGNFKAAIEQYKKAAQSTNRAVAAKALVRMGECYEKLGDSEARKAYERVVREYADQKEATAAANTRLGAISKSAISAGPVTRVVTSNS